MRRHEAWSRAGARIILTIRSIPILTACLLGLAPVAFSQRRAARNCHNPCGSCLRREHLEFHKSQAGRRGAGRIGVDIGEAGRLSQEAAKARVAKLHVLLRLSRIRTLDPDEPGPEETPQLALPGLLRVSYELVDGFPRW